MGLLRAEIFTGRGDYSPGRLRVYMAMRKPRIIFNRDDRCLIL